MGNSLGLRKYWNTTTDNCVQYVSRWLSIILPWYSIRLVMAVFNLYVPSNNQPRLHSLHTIACLHGLGQILLKQSGKKIVLFVVK